MCNNNAEKKNTLDGPSRRSDLVSWSLLTDHALGALHTLCPLLQAPQATPTAPVLLLLSSPAQQLPLAPSGPTPEPPPPGSPS